jgi:hypothetical protein
MNDLVGRYAIAVLAHLSTVRAEGYMLGKQRSGFTQLSARFLDETPAGNLIEVLRFFAGRFAYHSYTGRIKPRREPSVIVKRGTL